MSELLWVVLAVALVGLAAILLRGRHGPVWRWQRMARAGERVLLEDGLKQLYDCEYQGQPASAESLAGALEIPRRRATEALIRMEGLGLVTTRSTGVDLTDAGRDEALRILRVHRLWERYLAETSGMGRLGWHREAERREHEMSPQEVDDLSRRMGHPAYDPHGDPIPTADGQIPPQRGVPLTSLPEGELARVEHVEDEPESTYTELTARGLYPGALVQVTSTKGEAMSIIADGHVREVPPTMARGVLVQSAADDVMPGPFETLADLDAGDRVRVMRLSPSCRGLERRRLMDLGLVPGTEVLADMKGALGGPTAFVVRGATIALRHRQAQQIQVEREPTADHARVVAQEEETHAS